MGMLPKFGTGLLAMGVIPDQARSPLGLRILVLPLGFRMLAWLLMDYKASARNVDLQLKMRRGGAIGVRLGEYGLGGEQCNMGFRSWPVSGGRRSFHQRCGPGHGNQKKERQLRL